MRDIVSPDFFVKFSNSKGSESRIHIIVSKKVAPKSSQRNQIRRWIREALLVNKFSTPGYDVAFITRPSILGKQFQEIKSQIESAMKNYFV